MVTNGRGPVSGNNSGVLGLAASHVAGIDGWPCRSP